MELYEIWKTLSLQQEKFSKKYKRNNFGYKTKGNYMCRFGFSS